MGSGMKLWPVRGGQGRDRDGATHVDLRGTGSKKEKGTWPHGMEKRPTLEVDLLALKRQQGDFEVSAR